MAENSSNRLIHEKSPYLLQHAHNPVDWYPWGEEAIAAARDNQKPIFLSIGYSTCYWCHVMEREVFENATIARDMNRIFICIKVDREERPDIDRIYMTAVQMMTGNGGWPMSVFLTPDLKPFFAGTYFPPVSQYGRPGFSEIIAQISGIWQSDRNSLYGTANRIAEALQSAAVSSPGGLPENDQPARVFDHARRGFDEQYGGFGRGMKFPRPAILDFLLRYYFRTKSPDALRMAGRTLDAMASGGIHDQIGGGFHRYSVDAQWRMPHFEKMLYDQAQLITTFLDAYLLTGKQEFAETAKRTLDYVAVEMTDPAGGFYSAEDAESAPDPSDPGKTEEGAFYLWTRDEIIRILGEEAGSVFSRMFGVETHGNTLSDPHGVFREKNVLYRTHPIDEIVRSSERTVEEVQKIIEDSLRLLRKVREERPHPRLDDKIITGWNGLMITAFAKGFQVLGETRYLGKAESAARFIMQSCFDPEKNLLFRRYRDGEARHDGGLQDYAFMIRGLLDLYEASFRVDWLEAAIRLMKRQIELYYDAENGGFFETTGSDPSVILRMKEDYDGAEPSGNSVSALNLMRLSLLTANAEWKSMAGATVGAFRSRLEQMPLMLIALDDLHVDPVEIIIAGTAGADETNLLLHEIRSRYRANSAVILVDENEDRTKMETILPVVHDMKPVGGKAAVYVCKNYACQMPVTEVEQLRRLLGS